MKYLPHFLLIMALMACTSNSKNKVLQPKLTLLWQSDTLMTTCESVLFDAESELIYAANVNQHPWQIDSNGFISILDMQGNIKELKWLEGLSGPKGMGIFQNSLFVNDINRIVEVDIDSKEIKNVYHIDGAPQLNDITISPEGVVYVSGSGSNTIYKIENNKVDTIFEDDFGRLNGLCSTPEGIYYSASKAHTFGLFTPKTKQNQVLVEEIGHGDGVVRLENNDFLVSSWQGEVFFIYSKDWSKKQLLDTREQAINAADIDFIAKDDILLVPTFFYNRVMAYKLSYE